MRFHSGPTLDEISIQKQIRTKLKKCDYEKLYTLAMYFPRFYRNPFNPLKIIGTILFPSDSGIEAAEEYLNVTSPPKEDFSILSSFKSIFSSRDFGREAAEEYKARRIRNLAREVIAEKYPNYKQPTQLKDYL